MDEPSNGRGHQRGEVIEEILKQRIIHKYIYLERDFKINDCFDKFEKKRQISIDRHFRMLRVLLGMLI